ncbi:hypothetical protein AAG906_036969 [Vitis piasezkii]
MDKQHYRVSPDTRFTLIGGTCTSDPLQDPTLPISGPWPFAQWGMDIVGPLPAAPAQKKFLLVATDYFSKWVEAEAYASIKDKDVTKFVWKNIICRRSHKQDSNHCLKEKARASQRKMGGRVTRRPLGLSNHTGRSTRNTPFTLAYGMDTSSFCADKRSCKSSICFFSIETSVRSCLTSPSKGPSHPPPHASGHPLTPPGSLPQLSLLGEPRCPPERWISGRPPPISSAVIFTLLR